jgi:hypothetical protein
VLPGGKFAGTSPPTVPRPNSKLASPVSLVMFDAASVSTVCASEKIIVPSLA